MLHRKRKSAFQQSSCLRPGRISYIASLMIRALGNIREKLGRPLGRRVRLLLYAALAIAGILLVVQIVAPFLISITVVRGSMERAVAEWTGHEVSIGGSPEVRFWPEPQITLSDVTITREDARSKRLLARIDKLSASFELYPALLGRIVFEDIELTRPSVFVIRDREGRLDWANDGLLSAAVRQAASANANTIPADLDARVGDVTVENGNLELLDLSSNRSFRLNAINGELRWPRLSQPARIQGSTQLNGRAASFDLNSAQPLLLLSGRDAAAAGSLQSDLISGRMNGTANLAAYSFLAGSFDVAVPDVPTFTTWSGIEIPGAEQVKSLAMKARLGISGDVLRFEDLSLAVNEGRATGILDLALPSGGRPRLTGTLAFDKLDFSSMLAAIPPRTLLDGPPADGDITALHRSAEFDLRLSAQEAALGPFMLGDAAVSVLKTGDETRLDIADSDFEAGTLTGRLTSAKDGFSSGAALRLSIQNADFSSIARRLNLSGPLPSARGSLELSFSLEKPMGTASWEDARGQMRFTAGPGTIPGVNLAALRQLASSKNYFPLSEASGDDLDFDRMEVAATFAGGSAELQRAEIANAAETLSFSGVVPYVDNSLALSANITAAGTEAPNFTFFIGGSWPSPVILTAPAPDTKRLND
ncbi:hypothetical protein LCM4573_14020 [Rhizobium sp. LCM 4573]|nr:hypothetical protein LCM4573_14020 [Rhizobium sp. LCM 4573]